MSIHADRESVAVNPRASKITMYLYMADRRFSASLPRAMNKIILPSTLFTCRNCVGACVPDIAPSLSARTSRQAIKRGDVGSLSQESQRTVRSCPNIWMKLSRAALFRRHAVSGTFRQFRVSLSPSLFI